MVSEVGFLVYATDSRRSLDGAPNGRLPNGRQRLASVGVFPRSCQGHIEDKLRSPVPRKTTVFGHVMFSEIINVFHITLGKLCLINIQFLSLLIFNDLNRCDSECEGKVCFVL